MPIDLPLMENNISRSDLDCVINYLKQDEPRLTQGDQVRSFEKEWSEWLGVKHSVFVNSGSSANILTMAALRNIYGEGEVLVPTLTWVSDISSVIFAGLKPVFVDVDPYHLGMSTKQILEKINKNTRAVFLTHVLGFNAITDELMEGLKQKQILLIEDCCESHGATFKSRPIGSIGFASNFSYYFAHHMSTIEGGMVSTNDETFYNMIRMLRSHSMIREMDSEDMKQNYINKYPDVHPNFLFPYLGYNMRSTELNAVIGRNQLKTLDERNKIRTENCQLFYENLDSSKYRTDFAFDGSVNYAFILVLKSADDGFMKKVMTALESENVEFRRGLSGGGNQLRQPYLRDRFGDLFNEFPGAEHIHFYSMYIGNYPGLDKEKILKVCKLLNSI